MSRKRVLVLADLPSAATARLADQCQVDIRPDGPFPQHELVEIVPGYQGLLTLLTQEVGESVFAAAGALEIVSNYAVGVDNIDLEAARAHGVMVTNTPDVLTNDTADLAWALILAVVRSLGPADRFLREGHFEGWQPRLLFGRSLGSLTLGVVGAGRIGQAVLERAAGFGMAKLYTSRSPLAASREKELGVEWRPLAELLRSSDVVTLHVPLNSETYHMMDEEALRSIPKGAFLVNTARGPLVDEAALARVLRDGHLAGAGLDVLEREPEVESGLVDLDNVVLLPHIGSATPETRMAMADCCVEDLLNVLVRDSSALRRVV
jgi:glyoxylate reductase